jgi:HPr kinase/phosphorylase
VLRNIDAMCRGIVVMTGAPTPERLHATAVEVGGKGVLLIGPSGSGKSDLALRLIDRGATLISDDGVLVEPGDPHPVLRTAPNIAGMIEMRGVGIVKRPFADGITLHLVAVLGDTSERMPPDGQCTDIAGSPVRMIRLSALEASAPLKIEQVLSQ